MAQEFPQAKEVVDLIAYAQEELRLQETAAAVKQALDQARILIAVNQFDQALQLLDTSLRAYPGERELIDLQQRALACKREIEGQRAREEVLERCQKLFVANR